MKKLVFLTFLLAHSVSFAGGLRPYERKIVGGRWSGLNNVDASIVVGDTEAQDLLNVDIALNGYGIKKRSGFAQYLTIGCSSCGVRGGYYFNDAGGVNEIIHANNASVFKSTTSLAYSAFITTDTVDSYYDFVDSNGFLWRANNNRDEICRYNGTDLTYYPTHPKGNQIEFTPDRLVISGTTANPNRIHFSATADPTTFTPGNNPGDPWTDDIGLPGTAITAIKYALGFLFIWTRSTLSVGAGTNQYDFAYEDRSTTVGTTQPNTIVEDLGIIYFQGQDNRFYGTDGNEIRKLSSTVDVSAIANNSMTSKNWEQTSQSDWQLGTMDTGLSATYSQGDVLFSTGLYIDDFTDGDFTASPAWTNHTTVANTTVSVTSNALRATVKGSSTDGDIIGTALTFSTSSIQFKYIPVSIVGDPVPFLHVYFSTKAGTTTPQYSGYRFAVQEGDIIVSSGNASTWTDLHTGFGSGGHANANATYKIERTDGNLLAVYKDGSLVGSLTDSAWTSFSSLHFGFGTSNSDESAVFSIDEITYSTNTGLFKSQSNNIGTAITSWNPITINNTLNNGTISYVIYGDTNSAFTVGDAATFTSSATITNGAVPTIATAEYAALTADFSRNTSTETPTLNDFKISWNEGTNSYHFGSVDKEHRIIWSVVEGTNTVPGVSYIYDTINDTFLKYSFPMDAAARVGDFLYFGSTASGVVYRWPSGNTDDGNAITAYWKSKDYISDELFSEKTYKTISLIAKRQTGSNLDITYTVNTSSEIAYNVSLTDNDNNSFVRSNTTLPEGKTGTFFNIKFGNDDANAPFELYTFGHEYELKPWRVLP